MSIAQGKESLSHSRTAKRLRARARHVSRQIVRDSELGRVLVAALMGVVIAFGVAVTREAVGDLHHLLFGVPIEVHLSGAQTVPLWRRLLVPALGGWSMVW